jgi:hypothetical protein
MLASRQVPVSYSQWWKYSRYNLQILVSKVQATRCNVFFTNFKLFVPCILSTYEMKNQQMSLFQFYSYIDESLDVSGLQAHPQENTHSCSHNHWFRGCTIQAVCSICCVCIYNIQSTRPERYSHWNNGCVNSCVNSFEDGPVGPKHLETRRYMNKIEIVTSVGFLFHMFSRYIYFYKLLYMFQAFPPPIIRSTKLCIQSQVLSNKYCCLLLSWMRWNWNSVPSHPR